MFKDIQLSPHFKLSEFKSPDSDDVPPEVLANLKKLANELEKIRTQFGGTPIHINSGYRTTIHNAKVGGAEKSQHLLGKAADIVIPGFLPSQVQLRLKDWHGGLGRYGVFTHIDLGPKRRWDGP